MLLKITQLEAKRQFVIIPGASSKCPTSLKGEAYLPRSDDRKDMSIGASWGTFKTMYLCVEVQDSGRGLTNHERGLFFQR